MVEKAFQGGKNYWMWLLFLSLLTIYGFIFYWKQLIYGLGITGMGRDVSWGLYIANFTFFVGVAASAVMLVIPYYLHRVKEYSETLVFAEFLAVASVFLAILFVFVDLGKPDRVFNVLIYPSPNSLLFWDMVVLSGYLLLNVILGWKGLDLAKKGIDSPRWLKILIYISIPWAISIHTVTAFIYCGLLSRPFWFSSLLAPRFLASAFTSGPSILLVLCLVLNRLTGFDPGLRVLENLKKTVTYALSIHIFFLVAEFFTTFYSGSPEHLRHFEYLLLGRGGHYWLTALSWFSLIASIFSFLTLISTGFSKNRVLIFVTLLILIFAIWVEKGLTLIATGFNPTVDLRIVRYVPTFEEISITLGVWSLGALILTLLFKIAISIKRSLPPQISLSE